PPAAPEARRAASGTARRRGATAGRPRPDRPTPPAAPRGRAGGALLEETYYRRVAPQHGFGLQRVYTSDGSLDESIAVRDRDTVLVPRGYHTVSAPPGYDLYYLNVMAGPTRAWAISNDPDHAWTLH